MKKCVNVTVLLLISFPCVCFLSLFCTVYLLLMPSLLSIQQMYSYKVWQTMYNKFLFFSSFMSIWQPSWKLSQSGPFTKLVQTPDTEIIIRVKVMLFSLTQTLLVCYQFVHTSSNDWFTKGCQCVITSVMMHVKDP